jgi:hypothetical protein
MAEPRDILLREVDEELRREQLLKLWEQYGLYVLAAVAAVVIGIGGYKYMEYRRTVAAEAAGARYVAALREFDQQKADAGRAALDELARTAPSGYATLARLRLAAAQRDAGKLGEAAALYDSIANDTGTDPLLADFARLQAAALRLDTSDWTDTQNRLNAVAADSNPWRHSARELLGLAAYKAGKDAEARRHFQALIADGKTPPGIAGRARIMMAILTEAELARAGSQDAGPAEPGARVESGGEGKADKTSK